jgi:DNA-binding NarL/FixJ family response regulator
MFSRLARFLREADPSKSLPSLTSRESEILALVDQGFSNKGIARQLRISTATVKNHMHNILVKLQVNRRADAAARRHLLRLAPFFLAVCSEFTAFPIA